MKNIVATFILSAFLATTAGCPKQSHGAQIGSKIDTAQTAIALDWLRSNKNQSALATNRFGPTSAAVEFVEQLLASGATQVYVVSRFNGPEFIEGEGGPYADQLIVQLPGDPERRARLFQIIAAEAESEGFDPPQDTGQSVETLWWD